MVTFETFHDATAADFRPCERPVRAADFVSPSGSAYWNTGEGVIRHADHWGRGIRSCQWFLAGGEGKACEAGFAAYANFVDGSKVPFFEQRQAFMACPAFAAAEAASQKAAEERESKRAAESALQVAGQHVKARREYIERLSSRRYQHCVEIVTFVVAKITACFVVATDGRKFGRHTLSQWETA